MTTDQDEIDFLESDIEHMKMLRELAISEGASYEDIYYEHDLYIIQSEDELLELKYRLS